MIGGIIFGALFSWFITHWYYQRSNSDQKLIYSKLSDELRKEIRESKNDNLTVKDLNKLIGNKTINSNSKEPLPYKACPKCGSEQIKKSQWYSHSDVEIWFTIKCKECGWSESTQ